MDLFYCLLALMIGLPCCCSGVYDGLLACSCRAGSLESVLSLASFDEHDDEK